jgi:cbb3-type cytochrome oxidase maturation protein
VTFTKFRPRRILIDGVDVTTFKLAALRSQVGFVLGLALGLGLAGLLGFLWSLKSGQYDDLEGAAWRAIAEDK